MSKAIASKMNAILARLDSIESRLEKEKRDKRETEIANETDTKRSPTPIPVPRAASQSPANPLGMMRRRFIL